MVEWEQLLPPPPVLVGAGGGCWLRYFSRVRRKLSHDFSTFTIESLQSVYRIITKISFGTYPTGIRQCGSRV